MTCKRTVLATIVTLAVVLALGAALLAHRIPEQWKPWTPLRVKDRPHFLTRFKLARTSADPHACAATLAQTHWIYSPIADETTQPGCGYHNAVRIEHMEAAVSEPFAVSCRQALSLALWERHVLQPAARRYFGAPVTKLEHFGSYACRTVYGRPSARMSHHATADALDVAGFVIGDERRVRVIASWDDTTAEGAFLRAVHDGACRFFDAVLGPEYNAAHRDHFHLDRGSFRLCIQIETCKDEVRPMYALRCRAVRPAGKDSVLLKSHRFNRNDAQLPGHDYHNMKGLDGRVSVAPMMDWSD